LTPRRARRLARLGAGTLRTTALRITVVREHVLDTDHHRAINAIVKKLGASVAGTVLQDLLAYLVALAGYDTLRINPMGVPDIELTGLLGRHGSPASSAGEAPKKKRRVAPTRPKKRITIHLTKEQVCRITECCRQAGERELVEQLVSQLRS